MRAVHSFRPGQRSEMKTWLELSWVELARNDKINACEFPPWTVNEIGEWVSESKSKMSRLIETTRNSNCCQLNWLQSTRKSFEIKRAIFILKLRAEQARRVGATPRNAAQCRTMPLHLDPTKTNKTFYYYLPSKWAFSKLASVVESHQLHWLSQHRSATGRQKTLQPRRLQTLLRLRWSHVRKNAKISRAGGKERGAEKVLELGLRPIQPIFVKLNFSFPAVLVVDWISGQALLRCWLLVRQPILLRDLNMLFPK